MLRTKFQAVLSALLVMAGLCLFLYPTAADWQAQLIHYENLKDREQVYSQQSEGAAIENAKMLEDARAYNDTLVQGSSVVGAGERIPSGEELAKKNAEAYNKTLGGKDAIIARLKIPSIGVDLPVYKGVTENVLERGVGHLPGTALPVGGKGTHSVLSAHRGLASSELFTNLDKVKVNERFTVEVAGEILSYQVVEIKVVKPEQTEFIKPQEGRDLLTLVTCTPLGINSDRILVISERVWPTPVEDVEAAKAGPTVDFPWWMIILGGGILASIWLVWSSGPKKKSNASDAADANTDLEPSVT